MTTIKFYLLFIPVWTLFFITLALSAISKVLEDLTNFLADWACK